MYRVIVVRNTCASGNLKVRVYRCAGKRDGGCTCTNVSTVPRSGLRQLARRHLGSCTWPLTLAWSLLWRLTTAATTRYCGGPSLVTVSRRPFVCAVLVLRRRGRRESLRGRCSAWAATMVRCTSFGPHPRFTTTHHSSGRMRALQDHPIIAPHAHPIHYRANRVI